jgi:hypothetical protein
MSPESSTLACGSPMAGPTSGVTDYCCTPP